MFVYDPRRKFDSIKMAKNGGGAFSNKVVLFLPIVYITKNVEAKIVEEKKRP